MGKNHPDVLLTPVGELTVSMLGKMASPELKAKAHESLTLLRWLAGSEMPKHITAIPQGEVWLRAGKGLLDMWVLLERAPFVVPEDVQHDRTDRGHLLTPHEVRSC